MCFAQTPNLLFSKSELAKNQFQLGPLIIHLRIYHKMGNGEFLDVQVENRSDGISVFNPQDLKVVNGDGLQFDDPSRVPLTILPGTHIMYTYQIKGGFAFGGGVDCIPPVKIGYGGKQLAEIKD
jgi:hypothetical protein